MTKAKSGRIFCGTPTRGTSKGKRHRREAARQRNEGGREQAEVSAAKETRFSRSSKQRSGERGTGKRRKISPGGELREERSGWEEVVMRVVAECEDAALSESWGGGAGSHGTGE